MTRPKTLAALALGASLLAASALAQGNTENHRGHGSMMDGMHDNMPMMQAMTRMMDGCARMMQTMSPSEGRTDTPAPEKGQTD